MSCTSNEGRNPFRILVPKKIKEFMEKDFKNVTLMLLFSILVIGVVGRLFYCPERVSIHPCPRLGEEKFPNNLKKKKYFGEVVSIFLINLYLENWITFTYLISREERGVIRCHRWRPTWGWGGQKFQYIRRHVI